MLSLAKRLNAAVWPRVATPLAQWPTRLGVSRHPRALQVIYALSQSLTGLILWLEESGRACNQIVLYWEGNAGATDFEDVMNDIAELIERAPSPLGIDDYSIAFYR